MGLIHSVIQAFTPRPLADTDVKRVREFLRALEDAGGAVSDGDEVLSDYRDGYRIAAKCGYVNPGGGWDAEVAITPAGQRWLHAR